MKILQLCNRIPFPLADGGAIAMFAMTKSFADAGCEVDMLAINTKKHKVDVATLPAWFSQKTKLYAVEADTDVTALGAFLNLFSTASYNLVRFDIPAVHAKLKELLAQNKYDVIQLEGFFLSKYIPTIRSNSNALISMRAHNVEFLIWERMAAATASPLKKWYLNLLAKRLKKEELDILNKADCIIPISEVDQQSFKQLGAIVPMHVSTGGVDETLLEKQLPVSNELSLFHLAAMNWQPNVQAATWFLEKIWPLIHPKFPDLTLYLAGKDMPASFFQMQSNQIKVLGSVTDAHAFMNAKNIMIVPLLSGSGMRIKIVEGLALGKVIISTSIGAEGIACEDKKNILIADTAHDFAAAIELALKDKALCATLSKNAKELVKHTYTNSSIIKSLLAFYNALLISQKQDSSIAN
ncbi:MAG: glycosyltransferase [Bacteroidetes bacterium]|nr:glycosyltransferase [Bacteroidota bacterium]